MDVLPNELLLECFKYLDALDIFHSFDRLNYRFSTLIRSIPLYLDFLKISTEKYYQTCLKLLSDTNIKQQIYSLKLNSNNGYKMHIIKSELLANGFPRLHSLFLIHFDENALHELKIKFTQLSQLRSFHIIGKNLNNSKTVHINIPIPQLHTLTLPRLPNAELFLHRFSSIRKLRVCTSDILTIHSLLNCVTRLQSLYIDNLNTFERRPNSPTVNDFLKIYSLHNLKRLSIQCFKGNFPDIAGIFKRLTCLTVLTLKNYQDSKLFDVNQWECLIRSSLTQLKTFNIFLKYSIVNVEEPTINEVYRQFQSDFWMKEHKWYIECMKSCKASTIYTIPYPYQTYIFMPDSNIDFNPTVDRRNAFIFTNYVDIDFNLRTYQCPCYFPYVTSLCLGQCCLNEEYLGLLRKVINPTNIIALDIADTCQFENSMALTKMLKASPNISTLRISPEKIIALLDDEELCRYLSKMIRILAVMAKRGSKVELSQLSKIFQTFVNVEKLTCNITKRLSLQLLLESLPNLSELWIFNFTFRKSVAIELAQFFAEITPKLGINVIPSFQKPFNFCLILSFTRNNK